MYKFGIKATAVFTANSEEEAEQYSGELLQYVEERFRVDDTDMMEMEE